MSEDWSNFKTVEVRNSGGRYFGRIRYSMGHIVAEDAGGRRLGHFDPVTGYVETYHPFRKIGKGVHLLGTLFNLQ